MKKAIRIAVCCAGTSDPQLDAVAEEVGRLIAQNNAVLLCGGLGGGMEAAARGAHNAGGTTVGLLPGNNAADANSYISLPLATDVVIAVGGEWGTLSEIALARKIGRAVVLLRPTLASQLELPVAETAEQAVQMALTLAAS